MSTAPKLRAHTAALIAWCVEGLRWAEMQERLAMKGTDVSLPTIHRYCARQGYSRLHCGTQQFDPNLLRLWQAGQVRLETLKSKNKK